jgi:hypothetical protein
MTDNIIATDKVSKPLKEMCGTCKNIAYNSVMYCSKKFKRVVATGLCKDNYEVKSK